MVGDSGQVQSRSLMKTMSSTSSTLYYTYSSPPRVVHGRPKRYRNNIIRPRGVHDYFNVMWDPHVHRGTTTTVSKPFADNDGMDNGETVPTEGKSRKRRGTHNPSKGKLRSSGAGGNGYKLPARHTPPPLQGRHHHPIQTEPLLEELRADQDFDETDAVVQTEPMYSAPYPSPASTRLSSGVDAYTQVNPEELFDFDQEIQPVLDTLVTKILEQCLLETMEEEELAALKEQQNRFHQTRRQEQRELQILQEQQQRLMAEKERLRKHLKSGLDDKDNGLVVGGSGNGDEPMFTTSILLELLPSVLNSLRQEGFLTNNLVDGICDSGALDSQSEDGDRNPRELEQQEI